MFATFASVPGDVSKPNGDWCLVTPTFAVVLDGVSSPAGTADSGCRHGTPWYVRQLGSTLVRYSSITSGLPLGDMLAYGIEDVRREHGGRCDLDSPDTPAATVVMFREGDGVYDYLVLSDSTLIVDVDDGLVVVTDPRADAAAPEEQRRVFEHPVGSPEHATNLAQMVAAQRQLRNREGGYWVAAAQPEAAQHAKTNWIRDDAFGGALAVSDGVTRLHDWGAFTWEGVLSFARQNGPEGLIGAVRHIEAYDVAGTRYPRYRSSDDATAVLIRPNSVPDTPGLGR